MEWGDVQDMLTEEVMTESALKGAWKEASKGNYYYLYYIHHDISRSYSYNYDNSFDCNNHHSYYHHNFSCNLLNVLYLFYLFVWSITDAIFLNYLYH